MARKIVRTSIVFEFYPDEDELIEDSEMTEEEMLEYYKSLAVDDIYGFVKYNELYDVINVEFVEVEEGDE